MFLRAGIGGVRNTRVREEIYADALVFAHAYAVITERESVLRLREILLPRLGNTGRNHHICERASSELHARWGIGVD